MSKFIKNLVGLTFAGYCAISAVWLGKNLKFFDKLSEDIEQEKPKKEKKARSKKWIILPADRDDD